eukprot:5499966-Alexandrium_andersonii.AAC.1
MQVLGRPCACAARVVVRIMRAALLPAPMVAGSGNLDHDFAVLIYSFRKRVVHAASLQAPGLPCAPHA